MLSPTPSLADMQDAKNLGANIFRYQIFIEHLTAQNQPDVYNETFARIDQILDFSTKNGVKVVLDLHLPPGGFRPMGSIHVHEHFFDPEKQRLIIEFWRNAAARYSGHPALYGYDLLNEPAFKGAKSPNCLDLNSLYRVITQAIRSVDKRTPIIIESPFGDVPNLRKLRPLRDRKVIYSIHFYYPLSLTHQRIPGRTEYQTPISYPTAKFDKNRLKKHLQTLVLFQRKNKAKIYIGEFSCIRWAPNNSAANYVRDSISLFEANKWDWTYHAWRECECWSPEGTPVLDVLRQAFSRNR